MARLVRFLSRVPLFRSIFGTKRNSIRRFAHGVTPQEAPAVIVRSGPTLSGNGLLRSFGSGEAKSFALQGVSLDLHPNQMNLLMGPSGSGKTTLLAVVSALLRPCGGNVSALGQDIWRMNEHELERFRLRHCSYIFQGYNLFPALTAREQLEIVLRWGEGASGREARRRSEAVLGQLGLGKKMHLRPLQMSGGEKQRVAIGRALVKNPSFLFADEPTSALDWENGQQVIELLHGVARKQGSTVLVVTHDPRLMPYADRVFEMADGQLSRNAPGTPAAHTPSPVPHPAVNAQHHPAAQIGDEIVPLIQAGGHPAHPMPHVGGHHSHRPAHAPKPSALIRRTGPRLNLREPSISGS